MSVDVPSATVVVGAADELMVDAESLTGMVWADDAARLTALAGAGVTAQASAHGSPILVAGVDEAPDGDGTGLVVRWAEPQRRVAPGQSVVLYEGDTVLGGGTVTR